VAAGLCATCGALCCADCVELELGWPTQRAVCHACLRDRPATPRRKRHLGWFAAIALLIGLAAWFLFAR